MKRLLLVTEHCPRCSSPAAVLAGNGYDVVEPRVPSEAPQILASEKVDMIVVGHCIAASRRDVLVALFREIRASVPIIIVKSPITSCGPGYANCETLLWAIKHAAMGTEDRIADHKVDRRLESLGRAGAQD